MRIRLLDSLRAGDASVGELAEALGTSEQNVSKHLGLMLQAGILGREKKGNLACYAISDPEVLALCEFVCGALARRHSEVAALFGSPS